MKNSKNYPFNEGDRYFTVEGKYIIESVWDIQSEELYDEKQMYFATLNEAYYYYKYTRNRDMLDGAIDFIRFSNAKNASEFLEASFYFNDEPKLSLI